MEGNDGQFTDRDVANAIDKRHEQCRVRITALETALAAAKAEGEERAKQLAELRAEGVSALAAMTAERDALREAVRVLGLDVRSSAMDRSVNDNWMEDEVSLQVQKNPLARAAVEGER